VTRLHAFLLFVCGLWLYKGLGGGMTIEEAVHYVGGGACALFCHWLGSNK
jgi:hypothetical protein